MRIVFAALAMLAVSACATDRPRREGADALARGRTLAESHCSTCHAIGRTGDSPAPEAPPFRTLSRNYRVDMLEEAFAEGISVGHPAMPQFQFQPEDTQALVAYLTSVQDEATQ
jgi:mono/diheme cytochrome c family protein